VGFDEAKESIGARLLPILKQTLDYVINTVIPQFIQFKNNALKPITDAIENNREGFEKFVAFLKNFVIPFLIQAFGQSLETIGKIAGGVITVISKVTSFISNAVNAAIDGINALIRAYNKIPLLPDISTISKPSFTQNSATSGNISTSTGSINIPTPFIPTPPKVTASSSSSSGSTISAPSTLVPSGNAIPSNFDVAAARRGEERGNVVINVNAPSVIDEEGFSRAVALALNNSSRRTGGGGDALIL